MHRQEIVPREPAWVQECQQLSERLIDQGVRAGLSAMRYTPGLIVDPWAQQDVLALALRRALTAGVPLSATVSDVLNGLTRYATQEGGDVPRATTGDGDPIRGIRRVSDTGRRLSGGPTDAA